MIPQKLIIVILAIALSAIFVWFVIIDNYIIPSIISGNQLSFQNGYETGAQDTILGIMQQSFQCQPVTVWNNDASIQLIDVKCLQPIAQENDNTIITNP